MCALHTVCCVVVVAAEILFILLLWCGDTVEKSCESANRAVVIVL